MKKRLAVSRFYSCFIKEETMHNLIFLAVGALTALAGVALGACIGRGKQPHKGKPDRSGAQDPLNEQWMNLFGYDGSAQTPPSQEGS